MKLSAVIVVEEARRCGVRFGLILLVFLLGSSRRACNFDQLAANGQASLGARGPASADALTNEEFGDFRMEDRIIIKDLNELGFQVIPDLLDEAQKLDSEIRLLKTSKEKIGKAAREDIRKKENKLRLREPW